MSIMATQEELASLFSRNLSLNPYVEPPQEPKQPETPIVYSISQHYHHSSHLVAQQPPRSASEPPPTDQHTTEIILNRHGVDHSCLTPSQIDLFRSADASQQMRLVELWRICPPNYNGQAIVQDLGTATSFQQEEAMAKLRYERQMLEERMSRTSNEGMEMEDNMSDGSSTTPMPLTPIQAGDGRWLGHAEPYMSSGYEELARREYERSSAPAKEVYSHFGTAVGGPSYKPSTDPVYNTTDPHTFPNVGGDWERLLEYRQQAMENQYGAFSQQQHFNGGSGGIMAREDEEML